MSEVLELFKSKIAECETKLEVLREEFDRANANDAHAQVVLTRKISALVSEIANLVDQVTIFKKLTGK